MQESNHILLKYWGHQSFRPLQNEIISAAVNNRDVLALLPTGGGKSLCFQIPSLLQEGICIVISPLIALMEDQVKTLQKKDIKALYIPGDISYQDLDVLLDNCIYGNYKFLYLSPERLQQDLVQQRIKHMNVNLIAIDEAHCISQWGHDFRPAYLNISMLRELHPEVALMALTASATAEVIKDIIFQLKLKEPEIFKDSLQRKNLAHRVVMSEDKMNMLRQILQNKDESTIIYVKSRNATTEVSRALDHYGYSAAAFHGGMTRKEKSKKLDKWLKEEVKIMVATNAFGMGIDKSNVRQVVHLNLPESIESYFQEAGRAGRDLLPATATIFTNSNELAILKNRFLKTLPNLEFTILLYKKLVSYFLIAYGEGQDTRYDFNFSRFCSHYNLHTEKAYNTLQLLDRISIIKLTQEFRKKISIQFLITHRLLFTYLDENSNFKPVINGILRTYGGIFENKLPININLLSKKIGEEEIKIVDILKKLERDEIIEFDYQENDASIIFLVPREDEASIYPFSEYIKNHNRNKIEKISSMVAYVTNNEICRSTQLLSYFGEKDLNNCGICSVCRLKDKHSKKETILLIYKEIIKALESGEKRTKDLVSSLPYSEAIIIKVLQLLVEKEIIAITAANLYKLKHT